jgi:hypothetical protein
MLKIAWGCLSIMFVLVLFGAFANDVIARDKPEQSIGDRRLEKSWITGLEILWPRDDTDREYVNINLYAIDLAYSWRSRIGWELQIIGSLVDARGESSDGYFYSPSRETRATGLSIGGVARWNPVDIKEFRLFLEVSPNLLTSYPEFPPGGTRDNLYARYGYGLHIPIDRTYSVEVVQRWAHVSNGQIYENPGWDGTGITLSVRRGMH